MELNEHADHEGECDKEEENKTDDVFSYDLKGLAFFKLDLSKTHRVVLPDYSRNHPDIFTPPPEYLG